jgi:hypothetical protein
LVVEALLKVVKSITERVPVVEILVPIIVAALIIPTQARVAKREIIITLIKPPPRWSFE